MYTEYDKCPVYPELNIGDVFARKHSDLDGYCYIRIKKFGLEHFNRNPFDGAPFEEPYESWGCRVDILDIKHDNIGYCTVDLDENFLVRAMDGVNFVKVEPVEFDKAMAKFNLFKTTMFAPLDVLFKSSNLPTCKDSEVL